MSSGTALRLTAHGITARISLQKCYILIEEIPDGEHELIGGGHVEEVLIGTQVAGTVHCVVCVLSFAEREQGITGNLLVESPVLAEEVRQVEDVKSELF